LVQPGKNGFLVPVNDKSAFAAQLHSMLDPEVLLAMKRTSLQLAANFDLATLTRRLENILQMNSMASSKNN